MFNSIIKKNNKNLAFTFLLVASIKSLPIILPCPVRGSEYTYMCYLTSNYWYAIWCLISQKNIFSYRNARHTGTCSLKS